ncbi:hypothetical protein [Cuspidothrix issatschenkoi]|jgi:hypothetical protein|uniref:Uncharacterized protein n=1 Tax=Cuspidothrix issatschenkoi CHARLIE-1 TaxID=2052836 RepID=A0A2S6CRA4_9CYAN|nr:hypothetical protein [Cuspidothrix issatschenkoi]PPJ62276.1 hypothetical protein CUN59_16530 [Cuspidothrix issatschenkoi CHARLIE-1]
MDDSQEIAKIRAKLIAEIEAMDAAELKIKAKSEKSLKKLISDLLVSAAKGFGYMLTKAAADKLIEVIFNWVVAGFC